MMRKRNDRIRRWREQQQQPHDAPDPKPPKNRRVTDQQLFEIMRSTGAIGRA